MGLGVIPFRYTKDAGNQERVENGGMQRKRENV